MGKSQYHNHWRRVYWQSEQFPKRKEATAQWIQKDETTFDLDIMERKERWQYYTSSYVRIEPTEGVPRKYLRKVVLTRNLPSVDTESEDGSSQRKPLVWTEDLTLRICVNSFKIIYKQPGEEYFIYADKPLGGGADGAARKRLQKGEDARNQRFREKFGMNTKWMKDLNHDEVQQYNQGFQKWIAGDDAPEAPVANNADVDMIQWWLLGRTGVTVDWGLGLFIYFSFIRHHL